LARLNAKSSSESDSSGANFAAPVAQITASTFPSCWYIDTMDALSVEVHGQVGAVAAGANDLMFGREQPNDFLAEQSGCANYQHAHSSSLSG
jgi:hypothetical protein